MASTGWITAGSVADGGGTHSWANVANARVVDGNFASAGPYVESQSACLTYSSVSVAGEGIPSSAILDGIEFRFTHSITGTGSTFTVATLRLSGTNSGTGQTAFVSGTGTHTFGGAANKWGSSITMADVLNGLLGVFLNVQAYVDSTITTAIDGAEFRIHYTVPTLADLSLSASGVGHNAAINATVGSVVGKYTGSTLSLLDSDGGNFNLSGTDIRVNADLSSLIGTTRYITVRETLSGATNSPKDTVIPIAVVRGFAGPLWRTVGTVASGTANITPGLPSGLTVGDMMILIVETANQAVAAPSGWTEVSSSPQGTGTAAATTATRLTVFTRVYEAGDSVPTIVDPGDHVIARIHRFDPSEIHATVGAVQATSSSAGAIPTLTTTVDDCLIVGVISSLTDIGTARFGSWSNSNLVDVLKRSDDSTTQGNGGGIGLGTGGKVLAGSTGAWSVSLNTASQQGRIAIALKSLGGSEPPPSTRTAPRSSFFW